MSVHDAASHALSWLGSALGTRQYPLGVDRFGESGTIADLYAVTGISTGNIVNAALIAVTEADVDPEASSDTEPEDQAGTSSVQAP